MKLHMHPVSMTSRPVRLYIAEKKIPCEEQLVDLMVGEHLKEPYSGINPNKLVPVLEDDGLRLTESSAILKYLAEKIDSPAYPKDLRRRAKVNEMMDWLNTGFYRDFGYGLVYPQIFPHHKRRSDEAHGGSLPHTCFSGMRTTRPSSASVTLIWQDRRLFDFGSQTASSIMVSSAPLWSTFSTHAGST